HVAEIVGDFETRSIAPRWLDKCLKSCGADHFDRVVILRCRGPEFDDRIVDYLTTFISLEKLTLDRTSVTKFGLCRLKDALPRTKIEYTDHRDVDIRSPNSGQIRYLATEGKAVRKGEVLLTVASADSTTQRDVRATIDGTVHYRPAIPIAVGTSVRERQ